MGLRITTDGKPVTVYRQDKTANSGTTYQQYSLGVASKDKDGNWVNGFIDCQFKKGVDVANKAKINITNGFYIVSEYNGKKYYKIFVMEFEVAEAGETKTPINHNMDFMQVDDEDMPFN